MPKPKLVARITTQLIEHLVDNAGNPHIHVYKEAIGEIEVKGNRGDIEDAVGRMASNGLHIILDSPLTTGD